MPRFLPDSALSRRLLSALLLAPPVLALVWAGPPWSDVLLLLTALLVGWEWTRLVGGSSGRPDGLLLLAALAAAMLLAAFGWTWWALAPAGVAALLLLAAGRPWLAAGLLYLAPPLVALLWLRHQPEGRALVFWLLAVVWSVDSFAYLVGRTLRGPKLWPRVSPSKTWSGLAGGMLGAALAGGLGTLWLGPWSWWELALAGALLAPVAQAGDLLESAVKRRFGAKDASKLIPGHGGLLDRVDGLLAASLACAAAVWLYGN